MSEAELAPLRDRWLIWLLRLLANLPLPLLHGLAELLLWILHDVTGYRRALCLENLRRAFPAQSDAALKKLARRSYRGALQTLVESIKALRIGREDLLSRVIIENPEAILTPIRAGRPVVAAAAHQGNWEWFLLALGAGLDCRVDALYKHLNHAAFDRLMLALRSRFGSRMFAQEEMRALLRDRRVPRLIGMVADHGPQPHEEKHWASFLGIDTAFYKGPEQLARLLDAPLYFARMRRVGRGRYRVRFELLGESPAGVAPGQWMDRYVAAAEAEIRAAPQDWLWLYKRWKYPRPAVADPADSNG